MANEGKTLQVLLEKSGMSPFHEKIAYHNANREWLNKSFEISLIILDAIDDKGWSQSQLAEKLEVSRQQVSKYLNGKNDFKLSTIAKLEGVLGIELITIFQADEFVMKNQKKDK